MQLRDHETQVRIRAISFDSLTVDGNHCSFSGQAKVTRNGVTSIESFTVTCEDNSDLGAEGDVFTIVTNSYQGGGVLTGGNVSIHH